MFDSLRRRAAKLITRGLGFEAAAPGGRRYEPGHRIPSLNLAIQSGATIAAQRALYSRVNNPWLKAGVDSLVANTIGTGIRPRPQHPDPAVREALSALWASWVERADITGQLDAYGMQAAAFAATVTGGESFVRLLFDGSDPRTPLRLQLIDRTQVPMEQMGWLPPTTNIRAGIEVDEFGRRLAYWVVPYKMDDPYTPVFGQVYTPIRIPASDICHLYQATNGTLRGVSWLTASLLRSTTLSSYEDAELMRCNVAAMFAGFVIEAPPDQGLAQTGAATDTAGVIEAGLEPGTLINLPPGSDIKFSDPKTAGNSYDAYVKTQLRAISAGLGVTYEQLTGDYAGVTYSSVRSSLVEFRRRVEQIQHHLVVHQLLRPIWSRFVEYCVLAGSLDAPDFDRNREDYLKVEFMPPAFDYVDPLKDIEADAAAVAAGFKSRSQVVAEQGRDCEALDRELAHDMARAEKLGLSFEAPRAAVPRQVPMTDGASPAKPEANQ